MRLRDDKKRQQITAAAARLFASQPFHKVRLDDVAAEAGVGKGTLYIYFSSKEDLYFTLMSDGFAALVERVRQQLADDKVPAAQQLRTIIVELVDFGFENPQLFELMRQLGTPTNDTQWESHRQEFTRLVEGTIRRGVQSGEFHDAHPHLTALYIPGFLRAAMLYGPKNLCRKTLVQHIMEVLEHGLAVNRQPGPHAGPAQK